MKAPNNKQQSKPSTDDDDDAMAGELLPKEETHLQKSELRRSFSTSLYDAFKFGALTRALEKEEGAVEADTRVKVAIAENKGAELYLRSATNRLRRAPDILKKETLAQIMEEDNQLYELDAQLLHSKLEHKQAQHALEDYEAARKAARTAPPTDTQEQQSTDTGQFEETDAFCKAQEDRIEINRVTRRLMRQAERSIEQAKKEGSWSPDVEAEIRRDAQDAIEIYATRASEKK